MNGLADLPKPAESGERTEAISPGFFERLTARLSRRIRCNLWYDRHSRSPCSHGSGQKGASMAKVVLLSCVKSKRSSRSKAGDLYTSALFRKSLAYAKALKPDRIFILSAKHGLLKLDQQVDPYELTLNRMGVAERRAWAKEVLGQLREHTDLQRDRFVFLAGQRYREGLTPHMRHVSVPMEGMAFGEQLGWLTGKVG